MLGQTLGWRRFPREAMPSSGLCLIERWEQLALGGHSNRAIAQALFVRPKTVEYHLRNTYRKLGIEGRWELVAVLAA